MPTKSEKTLREGQVTNLEYVAISLGCFSERLGDEGRAWRLETVAWNVSTMSVSVCFRKGCPSGLHHEGTHH